MFGIDDLNRQLRCLTIAVERCSDRISSLNICLNNHIENTENELLTEEFKTIRNLKSKREVNKYIDDYFKGFEDD